MDNKSKNRIGAAGLLAMALGTGGWYAWGQGLLGLGPNTPTDANFRRLLKEFATQREPLPADCLDLHWMYTPKGEIGQARAPAEIGDSGMYGAEGDIAPPYDVVAYAREPANPADAPLRKQQIAAFDRLSREGFFEARDVQFEYPDGRKAPARAYTMTKKGWLNDQRHLCMEFAAIRTSGYLRAVPIGKHALGEEAYEIHFTRELADIAPWAAGAEFREEVERIRGASRHEAKIIAVRDHGVLSIPAQQDGWGDRNTPLPNREQILEVMAMKGVRGYFPQIASFVPGIILPADQQQVDEAWSFDHQEAPYHAIYYDSSPSAGKPIYKYWRARFKALVDAGVMNEERIRGDFNGPHPEETGVRYTFKVPVGQPIYRDPGFALVPAGRYELSFDLVHPNPKNYYNDIEFKGIARAADVAPWFRSIKGQPLFPEVALILDHGQTFSGLGGWVAGGFGISEVQAWTMHSYRDTRVIADDGTLLPPPAPGVIRLAARRQLELEQ